MLLTAWPVALFLLVRDLRVGYACVDIESLWDSISCAAAGGINGAITGSHLGLRPKNLSIAQGWQIAWEMGTIAAEEGVLSREDISNRTHHKVYQLFIADTLLLLEKMAQEPAWLEFLSAVKSLINEIGAQAPECFISYAWEGEYPQHNRYSEAKPEDLSQEIFNGHLTLFEEALKSVDVTLIRDSTGCTSDLKKWMSDNIKRADKIFLFGTQKYKQKACKLDSNLKFEFDEITKKRSLDPDCLIPIQYGIGTFDDCFPDMVDKTLIRNWSRKEDFYYLLASPENPLGIIPALFELAPSKQYGLYNARYQTLWHHLCHQLEKERHNESHQLAKKPMIKHPSARNLLNQTPPSAATRTLQLGQSDSAEHGGSTSISSVDKLICYLPNNPAQPAFAGPILNKPVLHINRRITL